MSQPAISRPGARVFDRTLLIATGLFAAVWVFPMVWILSLSFRPNNVLIRTTSGILPTPFTLDNYQSILNVSLIPQWLVNSLIVSIATTVLTVLVSAMAGYALARISFPGRTAVLLVIIAGVMVPEQAVFIPLHTMFAEWGLHNSYAALVLPRLALPVGVFLMTQFFRAVPHEIEEAADLDHASRFVVFWKIMVPLSYPALATLAIFTFLHTWNDFLWPLVSATANESYTVTVGLASIQDSFQVAEGLGELMASAITASLPVLIIYLFFQRYIVRGVAMGSTK